MRKMGFEAPTETQMSHENRPPAAPTESFEERLSTLRIATADSRHSAMDAAIQDLLALIRDHLGMDVVFVSEFVEGFRVVRHGCAGAVPPPLMQALTSRGEPRRLEDTLCQRLLDGRLPNVIADLPSLRATQPLPDQGFPIGSYLGVPVTREDGSVYGALCCLTLEPNSRFGDLELKRLQMAAKLVERLIQA